MTRVERARCPTCKKPVETDPERRSPEFPFCSARCRYIDLHRWLSGHYVIPGAAVEVEEGSEEPEP